MLLFCNNQNNASFNSLLSSMQDSPHNENLFRDRSRERARKRSNGEEFMQRNAPFPSSSSSAVLTPKNEFFDPFSVPILETTLLETSPESQGREYKSSDDANAGIETESEPRDKEWVTPSQHECFPNLVKKHDASWSRPDGVRPLRNTPPPLPPRNPNMRQHQQLKPIEVTDFVADFNKKGSKLKTNRHATALSSVSVEGESEKNHGEDPRMPLHTSSLYSSSHAVSSSSVDQTLPPSTGIKGALNRLSEADNESRQFPEGEILSEELQRFINEPSFAKLVEKTSVGTSSSSSSSNDLPPPLLPERNKHDSGVIIDVSEQKTDKFNMKGAKESETSKKPPRSTTNLKMVQRKEDIKYITSESIQSSVTSVMIAGDDISSSSSPVENASSSSVKSLSPEYESQAQQAAYQALQSQIENGVIYNSEEEQKTVYFAYYNYYTEYYLQLQVSEEEEQVERLRKDIKAQQEMQQEVEKLEQLEKTQREEKQKERIHQLHRQIEDLNSALKEEKAKNIEEANHAKQRDEILTQQVTIHENFTTLQMV